MKTNEGIKTVLVGACSCGHVRYELHAQPMFIHCCHCSWCQRETGSAFAVNALIESSNIVVLEGETKSILMPSNSGAGQTICTVELLWGCKGKSVVCSGGDSRECDFYGARYTYLHGFKTGLGKFRRCRSRG